MTDGTDGRLDRAPRENVLPTNRFLSPICRLPLLAVTLFACALFLILTTGADPAYADNSTTSFLINCSPPAILCSPAEQISFNAPVLAPTSVTYVAGSGHCEPVLVHISLDGEEKADPTVDVGGRVTIDLGAVAMGDHTLSLQGQFVNEGTCGSTDGLVHSWSGTVTIATAWPQVTLDPTSLSFGTQTIGTTSGPQTVTLTNSGNDTLTINSIVASADFGENDNCNGSVAAGASCSFSVTYSPTASDTGSGTLTIADNAPDSPQAIALSGCPAPAPPSQAKGMVRSASSVCSLVSISNVAFEQPSISDPNWASETSWPPLPFSGTVDGNPVKIVAALYNRGSADATVDVQFLDAQKGSALPASILAQGATTGIVVPPQGKATASFIWDTSGYAWYGVGAPRYATAVTVSLAQRGVTLASNSRIVAVEPKPVILVHGWNSNASAWDNYLGPSGYLAQVNASWQGFAVDLSLGSLSNPLALLAPTGTIYSEAPKLASFIQSVRSDPSVNAWHVDIVAHSMGGLVSRYYVQKDMPLNAPADRRPVVSHLVMLGTPNLGSPCAQILEQVRAKTGIGVSEPATSELAPNWLQSYFNPSITNQNRVPFAILAGDPYPILICGVPDLGDGVVPVSSAEDPAITWSHEQVSPSNHLQLNGSKDDFNNFVLPQLSGSKSSTTAVATARPVHTPAAAMSPGPQTIYSDAIDVAANSSRDVAITVPSGSAFGFTLVAPSAVGSSVTDPTGVVTGTVAPGSPDALAPLRGLVVQSPAPGTWTLHLTNTGASDVIMPVAAWIIGDPLNISLGIGQPGLDGRLPLTAALTNNGAPVTGASVTAYVLGEQTSTTTKLTLAPSGGGIYSGTTIALPSDDYTVALHADSPVGAIETSGGVRVSIHQVFLPVVTNQTPGGW